MGEVINLEGLTEGEIKQVKELIESLKGKKRKEKDTLRSWPLGIKEEITREKIYDWL